MGTLLWLVALAVVLWLVVRVVGFVAGALCTLIFAVIAVVALVLIVRAVRARRRDRSRPL